MERFVDLDGFGKVAVFYGGLETHIDGGCGDLFARGFKGLENGERCERACSVCVQIQVEWV